MTSFWKDILRALTRNLLAHLMLPGNSTTGLLFLLGISSEEDSFELCDPLRHCHKIGDIVKNDPQKSFMITSLPLVCIQSYVPERPNNYERPHKNSLPWIYLNFDDFVNKHPKAIERLLTIRLGIKLREGNTLRDYEPQLSELISKSFTVEDFHAIFVSDVSFI